MLRLKSLLLGAELGMVILLIFFQLASHCMSCCAGTNHFMAKTKKS